MAIMCHPDPARRDPTFSFAPHSGASGHVVEGSLRCLSLLCSYALAQHFLFSAAVSGFCFPCFPLRRTARHMNLRLPHPSRFLRRVGAYALTPQPLFTLLVVSLESLDFGRWPLKTPAATFPSNLRTCSPRFAKEGRTKKPYHILAPPRNSATSHPPAGHPACPPQEGVE